MIEKRKYPRQKVELAATLSEEGTGEAVEGRVQDLSIGGMFFLCHSKLPFGTKVKISVDFGPSLGTQQLPAVVRWTTPQGVGLQFGLLGARETHAIAQILQKKKA